MSTYSVRMFGLSSALLATFFGGFLFASAAAADLSVYVYDGPDDIGATLISDSVSLAPGDTAYVFEIELTPTGDGVELLDVFIEDESFDLVVGFSDVSCEGGVDDSPDDSGVVCFWDPILTGSAIISFGIVLDAVGEYTLVVITTGSSPDDEDIFEYTLDVADEGVPFTFDAAATRDLDGNGQIDVFKLDFLSAVDADTAATGDVSIAGYTVTSVIAWDGDTSALKVFVTEGTTSDTGATPDVTASGISGTNGTEIDETTLTAADESGPVMTSAFIAEDGASIVVTFGEDIDGPSLNTVSLSDFSLSENTIVAVAETSPGVVTLTLGATTTATTIDVTVGAEDIDDPDGNTTAEHTVTATEAPDTTPITITSVGLTTSATSTDSVVIGDTVTLTFALGEASATTTVGILDESDVAVATTSTTYTAAYTVDADTAAGAVTFSISVLDEAGNETVATTTTDGSSLTIVQPEEEEGGGGGGGDSSIPFSISLSAADAGMNLISLPVSPSDTAIASVLSGISSSVEAVWTYIDETWYVYYPNNTELSNLTTMDAGYAYWIEVSADTTLSGSGTASTLSRTLDIGWQLVGYMQPDADTTGAVSIDTAFASVGLAGIAYGDLVGYGTGSAATPTAVSPGEGFWMNVVDPSSVIAIPA